MKKYAVALSVVEVLFIFAYWVGVFANDITWEEISRGNLNLRAVLVSPDDPRIIYVGSSNAVLKSDDGGESWRNVLLIKGQNKKVNFLSFDPQNKNYLYAVTANGLFYSPNQGKNWSRIFKEKNYSEDECTALAILPYGVYLGTKTGVFVSKDKGRSWHREIGKVGNTHILAISYNLREPNYIYIACVGGVFKTQDAGKSWERIFITHTVENGEDKDEVNEDQDEEERFSDIRYISCDPNNSNYLYLAVSKGIYKSQDKGKTWDLLSEYGLLNRDMQFLFISRNSSRIYTVTKSGVFEYREERWHELSLGLASKDIRFLDTDNQNNLYAACDKGLFKVKVDDFNKNRQDNLIILYSKDEPKIKDVQQAAIEYAEVEPEKILRWRKQAVKKAWLPKVSMNLDRNTTDLWHWEGGSTTKAEDDILRRGRDSVNWDVNLSWDLGELIWNQDQTSIDVRSRLMVQLREDILDEITKLYFERLRVKIEMDNLAIEDRKKRLDSELRLEELTASLDALTGGYFSGKLKIKEYISRK